MSGARRHLAASAIALSMSGCLTTMGTVVGGVHAGSKNGDIAVQQGLKPRTSVAKWMAAGAGIGLVLDVALLALMISQDSGGSFGH